MILETRVVERRLNLTLKTLTNGSSTYQKKTEACAKIAIFGETTIIRIKDMYSEVEQSEVKIWLDALLLHCGEKPITDWTAKVYQENRNPDLVSTYLESLVVANTVVSRRVLIDLYRWPPNQEICLMVLENMAKLGRDWVEEVFIDQMLIQDPRQYVADKIIALIINDEDLRMSAVFVLDQMTWMTGATSTDMIYQRMEMLCHRAEPQP